MNTMFSQMLKGYSNDMKLRVLKQIEEMELTGKDEMRNEILESIE